MFDYEKLRNEWKRQGFTDSEIANAIGLTAPRLSDKLKGKLKVELTGTQIVIICDLIEKPIDMFKKI
jgi:predicted XRE-type DNA-binding protein